MMELRVTVCNPMTSQERIRIAQRLHKRAKDPNLSAEERDTALRHACNLMRINMVVAERELSAALGELVPSGSRLRSA